MEYLEFMFRSFPHFLGSWILIGIAVNTLWAVYKRTLKFFEILLRGYPNKTDEIKKDKN